MGVAEGLPKKWQGIKPKHRGKVERGPGGSGKVIAKVKESDFAKKKRA